jgi:hypothetical protein
MPSSSEAQMAPQPNPLADDELRFGRQASEQATTRIPAFNRFQGLYADRPEGRGERTTGTDVVGRPVQPIIGIK